MRGAEDTSPISKPQSKLPQGAGDPGEDSPLLIIPAAGRAVRTGTPEVMEGGGGRHQAANG